MAKNSLQQTIRESVRQDPGVKAPPVSTARIWHAPRLGFSGEPAVGFQPYREFGPVVLAVEEYSYAEYLSIFQDQSSQYFINPEDLISSLNQRDSLKALLNSDQASETAGLLREEIEVRLEETDKHIQDLEKHIEDKKEAERRFAEDHVREFIVVSDGNTQIDYNENPDDWEVIVLGRFSEASYCFIKPAIGRASAQQAIVPMGQSAEDATMPKQAQTITEKVQRLRNFSTPNNGSCKQPFQQADGRVTGLKYRYPKSGDTFLGPMRFNVKTKDFSFYLDKSEESEFLRVDNDGKISLIAPQLELQVDPMTISVGDFQENPLQTIGASNAVTPIPRFRPRLAPFNFVAASYNVIRALMDELEESLASSAQRTRVGLQYEVVDFNDFIPPGRSVE